MANNTSRTAIRNTLKLSKSEKSSILIIYISNFF